MKFKNIIVGIPILLLSIDGPAFEALRRMKSNLPSIPGKEFEVKTVDVFASEGDGGILVGFGDFPKWLELEESFTPINNPEDRIIREDNSESPALRYILKGHKSGIRKIFPLSEHKILSLSIPMFDDRKPREVKIWDLSTGEVITLPDTSISAIYPLSENIIITGHKNGVIKIWDLAKNKVFTLDRNRLRTPLPGREVNAIFAFYLGTGLVIVSGEDNGYMNSIIIDSAIGEITAFTTFMEGSGSISNIQYYPESGYIYSGIGKLMLKYNISTEEPISQITLGEDNRIIISLTVLPDRRIASVNGWGQIRVWDISEVNKNITSPPPQATGVSGVTVAGKVSVGTLELKDPDSYFAISISALPDGKIASGNKDGTIGVWDLSSHRVIIFEAHSDEVSSLASFPDGRIISGSGDGTIKVWDPSRI